MERFPPGNAPDKRVGGKVLSHGQAGDQVCSRVFPEEVAEVKYTGHPGVLLAFEMLFVHQLLSGSS